MWFSLNVCIFGPTEFLGFIGWYFSSYLGNLGQLFFKKSSSAPLSLLFSLIFELQLYIFILLVFSHRLLKLYLFCFSSFPTMIFRLGCNQLSSDFFFQFRYCTCHL
uniref:Macaca fascicularis brain cDNA clone: QflA-18312, similar to human similar to LINE-1 REVERSE TRANSCRIPTASE HOMOLOG(LOC401622), mRNA, RefSeq: XM_377071.1 n=1 Tax=Macaca fascicularis TaxID=9541 RepID=I7GMT8_MACFA|nr:unnamed protein product [Macaca fascicularis]